jgi:hypothetical protein
MNIQKLLNAYKDTLSADTGRGPGTLPASTSAAAAIKYIPP